MLLSTMCHISLTNDYRIAWDLTLTATPSLPACENFVPTGLFALGELWGLSGKD